MSDEAAEKALPGYKNLAQSQKDLAELLNKNQEITNGLLRQIRDQKTAQSKGDIKFRTKWAHEKRTDARTRWIILAITVGALYFDIISVSSMRDIIGVFN